MTTRLSRRLVCVVCLLALACGDDDVMMVPDGGPPPLPTARLAQIVGFEGHQRFINAISVDDGTSLEGATIAPAPGSPFTITEQLCGATVCGFVANVEDARPNRAVGVPSPIDAENHFVQVVAGGEPTHRSLLTINPIDSLTGRGSDPARVSQAVFLSTSATSEAGSAFVAATDEPARWVSFGDIRLDGDFDLTDAMARAGGQPGGDTASDAPGATGGAGDASGGGGGGGLGTAGGDGAGADGTAGAGGAGGSASDEAPGACLTDFARADCGGGGGGGGVDGAGGRGGGAILLVALGEVVVGGRLDASGADGELSGGGGAGGAVLLAGRRVTVAGEVDIAGGASAAMGGAGGEGVLRIDAPGTTTGVSVELDGLPAFVREATLTLRGDAPAESAIAVLDGDATVASTTADASGSWSVEVPLAEGLNRLGVTATTDAGVMRAWTGTSYELRRVGDATRALPVGAVVDVVYVP